MLTLCKILIEHEETFTISGDPDKTMLILYDVKTLMVDVIGGLLREETQGHQLALLHQA